MKNLTINRPKNVLQWLKVYGLYRSAFPAAERKPFSIILGMCRKGKTDVWCIEMDGKFLGLATTINGEDTVLLDYFAVDQKHRGEGIGSRALPELRKRYAGKGLFVEIESVYDDAPNREERLHRKQFYVNCGMEQMNVMVRLFGVKMELLGWDCHLDFGRYRSFYRDHYSPWAAGNISEETHPEAAR